MAFEAGVHHAVFRATVSGGGGPMCHLGRDDLAARKGDTSCPEGTQMPAEGNGTAIAVALGAAGVAGAVLVRRDRRHMGAAAQPAP